MWVGHEVCDALEHAPGLEHERRERDAREIHADAAVAVPDERRQRQAKVRTTDRSWEMR
jgi:hypothetical protein